MTEYSSDEEDRRGHNSSDLTPDDFDFDISSYTNQSNFFSSRWGWQTIKQRQRWLFRPRSQLPVENKKTERHRSKTDSRNNSKVACLFRGPAGQILQHLSPDYLRYGCLNSVSAGQGSKDECSYCWRRRRRGQQDLLSDLWRHCCQACSLRWPLLLLLQSILQVQQQQQQPLLPFITSWWGDAGPRTHSPSDRVHLLSRRAVNWQNKNNRTFQCKFENKCEITIKNRKTCQSCRFQVIRAMPAQWDSQIAYDLFYFVKNEILQMIYYTLNTVRTDTHKCVLSTGTGHWTDRYDFFNWEILSLAFISFT